MRTRDRASIAEYEPHQHPYECDRDTANQYHAVKPAIAAAFASEDGGDEQYPRDAKDQRGPSSPRHEDHMRKLIAGLVILAGLVWPASLWAQASFQPVPGPVGGATSKHYLSAASNNSTNVKATPGTIYQIVAINTTATIYYLRLYDLAAAPTCSSATGVIQTYPVPFGTSSSGGGFTIPIPVGLSFLNGIGFCLTSGIADTDNGNAATGVVINVIYQ